MTAATKRVCSRPSTDLWDLTAIPSELSNASRWINWKPSLDKASGKWKKPPCGGDGKAIDPHDPRHWKSLEVARRDSHSGGGRFGLGFSLGRDGYDDLVGVDFDHCIDGGEVKPDILRWVGELGSYTEITPSGDGLRVWVHGKIPAGGRRNDGAGIEVYAKDRYFTVTGRLLESSPRTINWRQSQLEALWAEYWPDDTPKPPPQPPVVQNGRAPSSDEELLARARAARGGEEFAALYDQGDLGRYGGDESRADFSLMKKLAFWTGNDAGRMESLFSQSALGQRPKWTSRLDYREATIRKAIAETKKTYIPPAGRNGTGHPPNGNGFHSPSPPPGDGVTNEAMDDPHRLARLHFKRHDAEGYPGLRFYRDGWLHWDGSAYRNIKDCELQSSLASTIKGEFDRLNRAEVHAWEESGGLDRKGNPQDKPQTRKVTRTLASNATLALQSLSLLPGKTEAPCWLDGNAPFDAREIVPTRNALVHLPSVVRLLSDGRQADGRRAVLKPTPRFFNTYSLDFDFDLAAPDPAEWLKFLKLLWADDQESIDTLQEWFGYCLTPDTGQQKILALIGPKRAGKDTIARVLTNLVGAENTAGPTLASLSSDFGLSPLIGKPLAVVSDARISGRTDAGIIVERLLTISGEGRVDIDRKYQEAWTGKLPTRFVLISNELPRLADSSGALAARMVLLRLTQSFYGREDKGLFGRLAPELPGILLWAIDGWRRLNERGRFLQPKTGLELIENLEELSSPVLAFGRDRCDFGVGLEVECKVLFEAWCEWCKSVGRKEPGNAQTFGRDLHAAFPQISTRNTRRTADDGSKTQPRLFVGIDVKGPAF